MKEAEEKLPKSFTLTMWDVKLVDEDKAEAKAKGFTLTMWDVKGLSSVGEIPQYTKFYLNYVGCKVVN